MHNSTSILQEKLQSLVATYAERLPGEICEIEKVWQHLQNEWSHEDLEVLHRMVHSLTGTGKTFGFAELSVKSQILEQNLKRLSQSNNVNEDADYLEINNQIVTLKQASKRGGASRTPVNLSSVEKNGNSFSLNRVTKIIIVDDDDEAAQEIKLQLEYYGYTVDCFKKVDTFKSAILKEPEAIVIMNVEFPDDSLGGINMIDEVQGVLDKPIKVIFISAHDSLEIRLRAVRAGSLAYFTKPINSSELIDSIGALTSTQPQEPFRVLIVDDSATLLSFHSAVLQQVGMTVSTVQDPMNILNSLLEFDPDLILMNLYMPVCSGVELAKAIRQLLGNFVSTPIVYLSSEDDFNTQHEAMSLAGDDFLVKPIEPQQLISAVTSHILRARMLRSFMVRDSLTGLYNHTNIKEQLDREISRAGRLGSRLTLAMVDIDFFKNINDTYGHSMGDRVIKSLARLLKQRLRSTDIAGRYGGKEFAIILTDTDATSAVKVINDIRKVFMRLLHISDGKEFSVSFSCGVADLNHYPDAVALGNAVDKALCLAKENGRNNVAQYPLS